MENILKTIDKYRTLIGIILILAVLAGGGILLTKGEEEEEIEIIQPENKPEKQEFIVVDIEGAVKEPGVKRIPFGSVVDDVIIAANGLSEDADWERISREINKAALVYNHSKIYIFRKADRDLLIKPITSDLYSSPSSFNECSFKQNKINLNLATKEELESLPLIGSTLAQRIIDYREKNGFFSSIEGIKNVEGIGEEIFNKIKDRITVE